MDFTLNEDQRAVQQTVRDFAQREIAPQARDYDERGEINWHAIQGMKQLGLLGGPIRRM